MSQPSARQITVKLPTLHSGQVKAYESRTRFYAVRCGRRWGKTTFGSIIACDSAVNSELIGWFAPDYKRMTEAFYEATQILQPVRKFPSGDKGVIRTITGGRIDFWTLEDEDAGRSRKYHKVIIDEAAFANDNMMDVWRKAIKPTLLDYRGRAMVLSNTNGVHPDQFFWRICNEPEHGFTEFHAPSIDNPLLPADEIENLQKSEHPLVFAQEYMADFVDWSGVAFFAKEKLLDQGKPVPLPAPCDAVFAVIDTAVKAGKEHDGTACTYYAANKHGKYPLVIADWDLIQIEGASLVDWLPSVFSNLETLARRCKARAGSLGAFIEDAQSGSILLQQARKKGWAASALPENLKDMGKDGRALNISGHVYSGKVKLSVDAYDKTVNFKGASRNHLLTQITSFRIGDKDAAKRADDLLDTFTYGVAISLGNAQGY